jgi:spore maturation protein CgeB
LQKRRRSLKVILSSNRNPHFLSIAEYIENAFNASDCQAYFFNNDDFSIPGRIRQIIQYLQKVDLKKINKDLISLMKSFKPHFFIETGGHRILPETVKAIKRHGIRTALWTIDCPVNFEPVINAAPYYDFVFTGGSEAYDILKEKGIKNLHFLPFACDPDLHKPQALSEDDQKLYGADIVFVGSIHPELYPFRIKFLESIADLDLAVWGPGSSSIPQDSPLKKCIRGEKTPPDAWTKIYSASKIVLCMHYKDPANRIPCHQASPRVYEALACEAFLMVDVQRDVKTLFKDREDLVLFRDTDELRGLIKYYLERPEERLKIAENGRKTVLEKHTYRHRIDEILKVAMNHD